MTIVRHITHNFNFFIIFKMIVMIYYFTENNENRNLVAYLGFAYQ